MVSKQAGLRAAIPTELREWVDNRLISAHIRIVRIMVLGGLMNAAVIVLGLWGDQVANIHLMLFAASMIAAGLHRLWLAGRRDRARSPPAPSGQDYDGILAQFAMARP